MAVHSRLQPVPPRALAISVAALAVPAAVVFWHPDWTSTGLGMLIWLMALIPAFLLSYYRGWQGVAVALAGGMAVITATQVSVTVFEIVEPNWTLLGGIVGVYLAVSIGVATLGEALRRERGAAEELAMIDGLTGLPNRRHVEEMLEREFAAAERGAGLTVVMFDLDHFKRVNDGHGHAAGDMTLKAFAKILKANTRKENLSARFGGEEFVSVLRGTDAEDVISFAQRVLDQMRAWPLPWGTQTVSAGIAQYQKGMGSFELLLGEADRALYQAKDGGRDMVYVARLEQQVAGAHRRVSMAHDEPPLAAAPAKHVHGKVWIVDDDSGVRSVLKRFLIASGLELWDTADPAEAIRHFAGSSPAQRPDVILTDVIMPTMTGMRMIDQLMKFSPDIKVIYMSGYVQSAIQWQGSPGAIVVFLEKPIELPTLLSAVEIVLRAEAGSSPPESRASVT